MRRLFPFLLVFSGACAPVIGDSCETSIDCSVNADRICDIAQPGGYCTVLACEPDTCPDDALCVEWRGNPGRTAVSYCMQVCEEDGDCRDSYACMAPDDSRLRDDLDTEERLASISDLDEGRRSSKFCAYNRP